MISEKEVTNPRHRIFFIFRLGSKVNRVKLYSIYRKRGGVRE